MADELNLTLPNRSGPKSSLPRYVFLLLVLVLGVGVVNLILSWPSGKGPPGGGDLTPEALKELALKFEKQDLTESAAEAWKDYLTVARIRPEERADIWYRLGKMYQAKGNYERALESFYRSESLAKVEELAPEISRRVQECLEAMGKFTALQNDLANRVGMEKSPAGAAEDEVARIGPQKITRTDLAKQIESQIDLQIAQLASYVPPEELSKQKEELLKRLSSPSERLKLLNQLIAEEMLYRRAGEIRLADDPSVRAFLKDMQHKILARKVMEKELADQIKITPGDLETYYEANKKQYVQPERAKIALIVVKTPEGAEKVLARLKKGEKFDALAKELSVDDATREKGGQVEEWIDRNSSVAGLGRSEELIGAIFSTEAGKINEKAVKTEKGFAIVRVQTREPEKQKTFEEVRSEVYQALRTNKEKEVQQKLLEELKNKYNVVIYSNKFAETSTRKDEKTR